MQDLFPIPSCFSPAATTTDKPSPDDPSTKLGHSVAISTYRAFIAGHTRLVTVTWCKNLLALGLYLSIQPSDDTNSTNNNNVVDEPSDVYASNCKVEMRPWHFWRRHGTKRFHVDGDKPVDVFWDLKAAKFSSDDHPEPLSDYHVALASDSEVVLLLGDLKHDAFRRSGARPSMLDAVLVSKKEHVFGKRRFATRARFDGRPGKFHEISVESSGNCSESDMVIKIDGSVGIEVRHLQWKFRGHGCVSIEKVRVEVYWDVHDWLFSPAGLRHALFIFKPAAVMKSSTENVAAAAAAASSSSSSTTTMATSEFCLFLYAWKVE